MYNLYVSCRPGCEARKLYDCGFNYFAYEQRNEFSSATDCVTVTAVCSCAYVRTYVSPARVCTTKYRVMFTLEYKCTVVRKRTQTLNSQQTTAPLLKDATQAKKKTRRANPVAAAGTGAIGYGTARLRKHAIAK